MGISPFKVSSSCSCTPLGQVRNNCNCAAKATAPNPDPFRFNIKRIQEFDHHVVAEVHYPGCTTFEGKKILILAGVTANELRCFTKLDPHFSKTGRILARFRPDQWDLACFFVMSLYE